MPRKPLLPLLLATALVLGLDLGPCPPRDYAGWRVIRLEAGPDLEFALREAFITARPGTVIELPEGRFPFTDGLTLRTSHIAVRGQGMDRTILDFSGQLTGAQGITASGTDEVLFQDFAIENPRGDGIRVEFSDGVILRRIRVEWTGGPSPENGSYGLYPTRDRDVLVEGCIVRGASDAGIYVGQSLNAIVRANLVEYNVAGIEIENSIDNDVYYNVARHNTGGILILEEPHLQIPNGHSTRVWRNQILENDTDNFAPGGRVALVPPGTGLLSLAGNRNRIFENTIVGNDTVNLAIVSFFVTLEGDGGDPNYDPYPEDIEVHDNVIRDGGGNPRGDIGSLVANLYRPDPVPDIFFDGMIFEPERFGPDGRLLPAYAICVHDNTDGEGHPASFSNGRLLSGFPPDPDPSPFDCRLEPIAEAVRLGPPAPLPPTDDLPTEEEIRAICDAPGEGIHWEAFAVDCPELSDYRLFVGNDPIGGLRPELLPYDLTNPLFSDYAQKFRAVLLPPGAAATYDDRQPFDFPVGTVIVKTFAFAHDLRDLGAGLDLVETRLLIRGPEGWRGIPYIWNEEQTEAHLAVGGGARRIEWIHTDGSPRSTRYQIPDVLQCRGCHVEARPIGPKARLLNRPYPYPGGEENQLVRWARRGALVGAPADPALAPRLPVWNDPADGSLEERARGYLESNCAHCHEPNGPAKPSGLFLEANRPIPSAAYGFCKTPVSAGRGAGGLDYDLVPGDPDVSILLFRLASAEPAIQMPELSKSVVHEEGVALVRAWIASLPGGCP